MGLSPIAILFFGILTAFPNITIPTDMVGFVSTCAFLGCIGLGAFVLWLYWVKFNLFETTYAIAAVMILGTACGKYALRARMMARRHQKTEKNVHKGGKKKGNSRNRRGEEG